MKPKSHRVAGAGKRLPRITQKEMRNLVYRRLQEIDSARSLAIYIIMVHTDNDATAFDDEIMSLRTDPSHYSTFEAFSGAYEPTELVRKSDFLRLSCDPESVAKEKFREAEQQCADTNRRMGTDVSTWASFEHIHARAQRYISNLLGELTPTVVDSCVSNGGWGKGVTSTCKGAWLSEYHKLAAKQEATPELANLAPALMRDVSPLWDSPLGVTQGSKLAFVPKDARTHRSIAIEPSLNLFLQKGIGLAIRRRLHRRWNLDLTSQTRNQELARTGSIDNSYATIDLSSASDTIARGVVERLLPPKWMKLLSLARSPFTVVDGSQWLLAKWSSMGNGYTFELETAIFAALVRCVIEPSDWKEGRWAVYGDDIIVPTYAYEDLCRVLSFYGFTLNDRKTFHNGPFRESCGADYYLGKPVRPFYLKKTGWLDVVNFQNFHFEKDGNGSFKRSAESQRYARKILGSDFPRVPHGSHGLVGIHVHFIAALDHGLLTYRSRKGAVGWSFSGLAFEPVTVRSREIVDDRGVAVIAHLRTLMARGAADLSEPWLLTMSKTGRWVRRVSML